MSTSSNWARRYGAEHRRLCARPGCGAPAAATLRFQPTQREAWLVDLDDDAARTEGDLCARHAAGLVLPRGWQLHNDLAAERDDRRAAPAPSARAAAPRSRVPAGAVRRPSAVELPGLSAVTDPDPRAVVVPPPSAPVPAQPPAPLVADATPEASEAFAETLAAETPLLRRAFSNVWLPDGNAADDANTSAGPRPTPRPRPIRRARRRLPDDAS